MKLSLRGALGALVAVGLASASSAGAGAADRYFATPIQELQFQGERPRAGAEVWVPSAVRAARQPYAALDGPGEVYLLRTGTRPTVGPRWGTRSEMISELTVTARVPPGAPAGGTLFLPLPGGPENADPMRPYGRYRFRLEAPSYPEAARRTFLEARAQHYTALARDPRPGAAWFRFRAREARAAWEAEGGQPAESLPAARPLRGWRNDFQRSYDLFSGGRALSENLALDTLVEVDGGGARTVPVDSIPGIETPAMDWEAAAEGLEVQPDPLAGWIPVDQHALFFGDFARFTSFLDEAQGNGLGLFEAARPSPEHVPVRAFYEHQMAIPLDALSRLLGARVVRSVALTGSDPFLPTGTDVALLFETPEPDLLLRGLIARQEQAAQAAGALRTEDRVAGLAVSLVRTPDRSVSSYAAAGDGVVLLSNSRAQLERLIAAGAGSLASLDESPEYTFFRNRYPREDPEPTAFLILTDATIRRWCGPRWRIAASRRVRARAHLAEEQARWIAAGRPAGAWSREAVAADLADLGLVRQGSRVQSETYGTLDFQTPILELAIDRVTPAEEAGYEAFRDRYQRSWREFFDPVAASIEVGAERTAVDLSVMPLIAGSEYRELIELCGDAQLAPDAGDPHPTALVHLALALDPEGRTFQMLKQSLSLFSPELEDPLGWVGDSAAVWLDEGPLWQQAAEDPEVLQNLDEHLSELPLCLRIDSSDPLRLAAFLTAVRTFAEGSAPGLVEWHPRERGEDRWVEIRSTENVGDYSLHYAALPEAWLVSLNEDALLAALERRRDPSLGSFWSDPTAGDGEGASQPAWRGRSLGLRLRPDALEALRALFGEEVTREMRLASWSAIPILNEWHRLDPKADAVALQRQLWGTVLSCPGGGRYVWNEDWQTYESTLLGHPADPRPCNAWPAVLERAAAVEAGLTFEQGGLRARVELAWR